MFRKWFIKLAEGLEIPCLFAPRHTTFEEVPDKQFTYRYEASTDPRSGKLDAVQQKAYCNYCGDVWCSAPIKVDKFAWRNVVGIRPRA